MSSMGNDGLRIEIAIWQFSFIKWRLWLDFGVLCIQMDWYVWVSDEVVLIPLDCEGIVFEFGLYIRLSPASGFFTLLQTEILHFLSYMSPTTTKVLSSTNHPNSVELLSMEFAAKMRMPYTEPPMITSSDKMKSLYVGHNKSTLFGRVLDGRMNMTTIKSALEKAWSPFKIEDMCLYKGEIYQIRMESQEQVASLLLGQPWIVAQHIFQIISWMDFYETNDLNFSKFYVWMQLHNYPDVFLDKEIIEGNLVETGYFDMSDLKFLELYPKTDTQPNCVRVKVVLDVHAPIPPGFLIPVSIDGVDWISFLFEYLPVFCFKCGFIGHNFATCKVTEDTHGTDVRVSPGGQRFQFYSSKTRMVPKPFGERSVSGFSLMFNPDLNKPFLPMIKNVADSSVNSKRTPAEKLKAPMIIDISSPQPVHECPRNEPRCHILHDHLPIAVEAHNPDGWLHNQDDYSYKRQEISQGVAAKEKMIHDRENVNELVDSFFEVDRESRRKTPIHDEGEVVVERPNTQHKSSTGKGKKLQSVKGPGRVRLIKRLGDFESFVVPSCGLSGGLWIFWEKSVVVDVLMYDSWFIHCKIAVQLNGCELFDLGFVGSIYTWTNKQNGSHRIWERIDRMMANEGWRSTFSGCRVHHELATTSDHKFLILKLLQDRVMIRRPFRFEIMWAQHDGCQEQIRDAFHKQLQGSPSFVLCKKLQNCKENLRWWNKHVFGDVEHKLDCVLQRLSEIQRLIENHNDTDDLFRVENELIFGT
ncbi:hypothetical protein IFM89_023813 [Coptis chinensis]|uniref:DUF4283 domain-containing protein n=1 Tax=Coptis chinensis TaxID=261450 RepID=A0A835HSM9_9MAGN|nr:hypothetical protein IFM89_023813 [Coptis chinensis]